MNQNAAALFMKALSMLSDRRLAMTLNRPNSTSQWVSARMSPRNMTRMIKKANERKARLGKKKVRGIPKVKEEL